MSHENNTDLAAAIPLSKPQYIYAFSLLYLLFAVDFAVRLGIVTVFPMLQAELKLNGAQLGLASSVVLLGMSCFVLPFSYLADKTSKKKSIAVMTGIWGVGTLLVGIGSSLATVIVGRFFTGIGNAAYAPISVSLLTSWTRKLRWGAAVGFYNSAMIVGLSLGTAGSSALAVAFGWRTACIAFGVFSLVLAVLSLTLPREKRKEESTGAQPAVNLKEGIQVTLKNPTLLLLGLSFGTINMALTTMIAWLPMYLTCDLHWDTTRVGAVLSPVYLVSGLVMMPLGGMITDRLGKWDIRTRCWFGTPTALLAAAIALSGFYLQNFWLVAGGLMIIYLPVSGVHVATQELVPARYRASAYGTYVMLLQGLGFLGPIIAGALSDAYGITRALMFIQSCFALGGLGMFVGGLTYKKDFARARAIDAAS